MVFLRFARTQFLNTQRISMATVCQICDRSFKTEEALEQHRRDSPAHVAAFDCEECDRTFNTEEALEQHLRDSPAHTYGCEECQRTFNTEEALEQHLRDSLAHAAAFECEECDRTFDTEEALQQHLRTPSAHHTSPEAAATIDSFDMRPTLHQDVIRLLRPHGLVFNFCSADDLDDIVREHDTSIMGKFTCANTSCSAKAWTSRKIATWIRQYPGLRYNARVYYQRCKSCNSLSRPELDYSYAERVSYRLAKWSGINLEEPPHSGHTQRPHQSRFCEGCRLGRCEQSRL